MSWAEIYALTPLALLGIGSVFILLLGAFVKGLTVKELNLIAGAVALLAAIWALTVEPGVSQAGGLVGFGWYGRLFTAVSGLSAFLTILLSIGYIERRALGREEYPALVLFAAFSMALLASSVSLLGVFLGVESMSLALYILLASNREDPLSTEAGLKYLIIGAVSTAFFAFGLSLIYLASGSLMIPDAMRGLYAGGVMGATGMAGWAMVLVGLGFKTAMFPFHLWAPDVYEGGPAPVVALLSTGSKAAVFAAFLNLTLALPGGLGPLAPALCVAAVATMAFGNIAALTQDNLKRLLAYSSIAQAGYVLVALIAAPYTGPGAAIFYLIAYVVMDLGAFGVVASFSTHDKEFGSIEGLKGQGYVHPFRGAALTVSMFSLAGIPPTAGFIGKFGVFQAAFRAGYVWLTVLGILTAIISVYYYLRVIVYLYMRPADDPARGGRPLVIPSPDIASQAALALLMAATIALGVWPGPLLKFVSGLTATGL